MRNALQTVSFGNGTGCGWLVWYGRNRYMSTAAWEAATFPTLSAGLFTLRWHLLVCALPSIKVRNHTVIEES